MQTDFVEHAGNGSPVHFCCFSKVVVKLLVSWVYMKALEPFPLELKSKIKKIPFIIWSNQGWKVKDGCRYFMWIVLWLPHIFRISTVYADFKSLAV